MYFARVILEWRRKLYFWTLRVDQSDGTRKRKDLLQIHVAFVFQNSDSYIEINVEKQTRWFSGAIRDLVLNRLLNSRMIDSSEGKHRDNIYPNCVVNSEEIHSFLLEKLNDSNIL